MLILYYSNTPYSRHKTFITYVCMMMISVSELHSRWCEAHLLAPGCHLEKREPPNPVWTAMAATGTPVETKSDVAWKYVRPVLYSSTQTDAKRIPWYSSQCRCLSYLKDLPGIFTSHKCNSQKANVWSVAPTMVTAHTNGVLPNCEFIYINCVNINSVRQGLLLSPLHRWGKKGTRMRCSLLKATQLWNESWNLNQERLGQVLGALLTHYVVLPLGNMPWPMCIYFQIFNSWNNCTNINIMSNFF